MASLSDLRRWLMGEPVEGLPDNPRAIQNTAKRTALDLEKLKAEKKRLEDSLPKATKTGTYDLSRCRYTISDGGDDALLAFGKHSGKLVSALASDWKNGRDYLKFLLEQSSLPEDLGNVIKIQLTGEVAK